MSRKIEDIAAGKSLAPKNSITMSAKGDSFIILSATEKAILDKMISFGKPLKDWDISINRGVLTGYNEAFIIDTATKDALIEEDSESAEIIKPLLRGRDIKRYSYEFADKWLINTHNGLKSKEILPIDVNKYPAIKNHLDRYSKQIIKRQDKGETPYNLRSCAYLEDFEKPKIVWKEMGSEPAFIYDINNYYVNDTCRVMVGGHLLFLLGFFHSKAGDYCFKKFFAGGGLGNTGFRYKSEFMYDLPIPTPTTEQENIITALVKTILDKKSKSENTIEEEKEIDIIVYGLYNLSEEEIKIVRLYTGSVEGV